MGAEVSPLNGPGRTPGARRAAAAEPAGDGAMADFRITRIVDLPRDVVFAVVADVERYPEFVPGFANAHVRPRGANRLEVLQRVGIKSLTVSFRSMAELDPPERIVIRSADWPFKRLDQEWRLEALDEGATRVTFRASYALASERLRRLVAARIDRQLRRMVEAFERRLEQTASQAAT